tara:strand:- start:495 stop:902 length:408 start_codon:yes stop_codon:yes gene_type:complete
MTDFTWKIESLDRRPTLGGKADVVIGVHYRVYAVDGEYQTDAYGSIPIGPPGDDFKAFADLTADDCKGWVLSAIAASQTEMAKKQAIQDDGTDENVVDVTPDAVEKSVQSALEQQISEQKQPSIVAGVPSSWAAE